MKNDLNDETMKELTRETDNEYNKELTNKQVAKKLVKLGVYVLPKQKKGL